MKQKFRFYFYSLCINTLRSKNTIEWDGSKIQDFGETKLNLPNFKNEVFFQPK
jgi:hypothetical protein